MSYLKYLLVLVFSSVTIMGCSTDDASSPLDPTNDRNSSLEKIDVGTAGSNISSQTLWAGQSINAGSVNYEDIDTNNDNYDDAMKVTFTTTGGWELTEAHFFVGASLSAMPTTKSGNPQIGQFPYASGNIAGQTSYSFIIPFTAIGYTVGTVPYFVAAHAALRLPLVSSGYQTETGWGDGQRLVQRGTWAMYNLIYISRDVPVTPATVAKTETAFAYHPTLGSCFSNYSEFISNPNRWGWTIGPLAPLTTGEYSFPIYAGAGQCNISNGAFVGTLTVNYNGSAATVTYNISGTNPTTNLPYSLRETHLYAGSELFPRNNQNDFTIAPGQYPLKTSNLTGQTKTYTVSNLSGNIYVIAHAVVYGFPSN